MAKDPAFLFYPGDWLGGTMYLTHQEKGCYMDLLMLQFNKGKFTLAQAKHMLGTSFDLAWASLAEKFTSENGLYWNERLHEEKEKRARFSESRRNNAKTPKNNGSTSIASEKHMHKHMEDENENENKEEKIKKGKEVLAKKLEKEPPLILPYASDLFLEKWNVFINMKKQRNKSTVSKQAMLNELRELDEEYSIKQLTAAIAGEWQGLTFADTKQKFEEFKNKTTYKHGTDKKLNITSNCEPGRDFGKL